MVDLVKEYHDRCRSLDLTSDQRRQVECVLLGRLLGLCEEACAERALMAIREETRAASYTERQCPACHGRDFSGEEECQRCYGNGAIREWQ